MPHFRRRSSLAPAGLIVRDLEIAPDVDLSPCRNDRTCETSFVESQNWARRMDRWTETNGKFPEN